MVGQPGASRRALEDRLDKLLRKWELYDLKVDRCETRDLAQEHPARVAALKTAWFAWAEKTGLNVKNLTGKK